MSAPFGAAVIAVLFVAVAGIGSAPALAQAPPNDAFAAAQPLATLSGVVEGTNVGATGESGEPEHNPDEDEGDERVDAGPSDRLLRGVSRSFGRGS